MSNRSKIAAPPPAPDTGHLSAPSDRVVVAGAGAAALWVLTWLTVQLHGGFNWDSPLLSGLR